MYLLPFLEWSVVSPLMKVTHVLEIPAKQTRVFKTLDFVSTKDACVGNLVVMKVVGFIVLWAQTIFAMGKIMGIRSGTFMLTKKILYQKNKENKHV